MMQGRLKPQRARSGWRTGAALVSVAVLAASCSTGATGDEPASTAATIAAPATLVDAPVACAGVTPLFSVRTVLDGPQGSCLDWVDLSYGRAVRGSTGSATIWTRRSDHGTALIVGAVHTLGLGWFGPADTNVAESIVNPGDQIGIPRLFLIRPDGSGPDALASPWFGLYNPAIAAGRNNNLLLDVLPREDFYVAVADSQKLDVSGLPPPVEPIIWEEVPLYDPAGATRTNPTWADPVAGELVLLFGYPQTTAELTASVGRVLTDGEAERAVTELAGRGDPEGSLPYEASVEIIIQGEAKAGMSGGPVVDKEGRLVGILVRATDIHDGTQYVRAVRMSYVVSRLAEALDGLGPADREAIQRYLESSN